MKPKITYYFDALCGWCYGFSPVIDQVHDKYRDQIDFEIVSGGLNLGNNSGPIGIIAPYIKEGAYKRVEEYSGVKFGAAFVEGTLEKGTMVMNSLPPATALAIVKEMAPDKAFEYGTIMHRAVYVDGMEPEDLEWYGRYAEWIGLDAQLIREKMEDARYIELAQADFQRSGAAGVNGYPTAVWEDENGAVVLTRGFRDGASFEALVLKMLNGE